MVSQGYLDNMSELEVTAGEPCKCEAVGQQCRGCVAREEVECLSLQVQRALDRINSIPKE